MRADDNKPVFPHASTNAGPLRMITDPATGVPSVKIEFREMPNALTAAAVQLANSDWLCLCQCATPVLKFPIVMAQFEELATMAAAMVLEELGSVPVN